MNTSTASAWPAPTATGAVHATVDLPGSKSLTNRALLLAAIADSPSVLEAPLVARDTTLMAAALRSLGVAVEESGSAWTVRPGVLTGAARVDCGLAGTVMRFVPPVAALADGPVTFDGDPHARKRPMGIVVDALRALGVSIDDDGRAALPFTLRGTGGVAGGEATIDASASSQFVSGLLLAGARYDKGLTLHHDGAPVPSMPHVEMTVQMLRARGVDVDDTTAHTWRVAPGPVGALDTVIEPDLSNAAPFLAAALLTGGEVRVPRWPARTTQPGDSLRDLLTRMGAVCDLGDDSSSASPEKSGSAGDSSTSPEKSGSAGDSSASPEKSGSAGELTVRGGDAVHGIDADLHDVGELTPVIAALAAVADGPSRLRGIAHIRGHETDRLAALAAEINGLGGDVSETDDGLAIRPVPLHAGTFRTYADHRMAHAGAVLGLVVPGIEVDDIASTTKTLSDFPGMWAAMLGSDGVA